MQSSDNGWAITVYTVAAILIFLLWLVFLAVRKSIRMVRAGSVESVRNRQLGRTSLWLIGLGAVLLAHFWYAGGPNKGHVIAASAGYFEGQVGVILVVAGCLTALFSRGLPKSFKKTSRLDKYPPLGWARRHKYASTFISLAVLILGLVVYERLALELNKRAFAHARAAIDTVYADIVAQVGPPDNSARANECSRTHVTFGEGDLTCSIDTDFVYGVSNEDEATAQFKKIQAVIKKDKEFKAARPLSSNITDQGVVNTVYHTASDEFSLSGLPCIVNYAYDTPREIFLSINDKNKKPLQIVVGCHGMGRAMYYHSNE